MLAEGSGNQCVGCPGMIRALAAMGFRSFHIMAHSVGVRVVMASVPLLEQLFQPSDSGVPALAAISPEPAFHPDTLSQR